MPRHPGGESGLITRWGPVHQQRGVGQANIPSCSSLEYCNTRVGSPVCEPLLDSRSRQERGVPAFWQRLGRAVLLTAVASGASSDHGPERDGYHWSRRQPSDNPAEAVRAAGPFAGRAVAGCERRGGQKPGPPPACPQPGWSAGSSGPARCRTPAGAFARQCQRGPGRSRWTGLGLGRRRLRGRFDLTIGRPLRFRTTSQGRRLALSDRRWSGLATSVQKTRRPLFRCGRRSRLALPVRRFSGGVEERRGPTASLGRRSGRLGQPNFFFMKARTWDRPRRMPVKRSMDSWASRALRGGCSRK
jgi:hypothetical protein